MNMTWSRRERTSSLLVARITVLFLSRLRIHFWKMLVATRLSRAENTSSRTRMSGFWYTALAREILCFCPPDRLIPFSPISVRSPFGMAFISYTSEQAVITVLNQAWLNGRSRRMLFLMVPLMIHEDWGQ